MIIPSKLKSLVWLITRSVEFNSGFKTWTSWWRNSRRLISIVASTKTNQAKIEPSVSPRVRSEFQDIRKWFGKSEHYAVLKHFMPMWKETRQQGEIQNIPNTASYSIQTTCQLAGVTNFHTDTFLGTWRYGFRLMNSHCSSEMMKLFDGPGFSKRNQQNQ